MNREIINNVDFEKQVKEFVKIKMKDVKSVEDIIVPYIFKISNSEEKSDTELYRQLGCFKRILQLTINTYNNFEDYKGCRVKFTMMDDRALPYYGDCDDSGYLTCVRPPTDIEISTALYNYVHCFLSIEMNGSLPTKEDIDRISVTQCTFCEGEIVAEMVCEACGATVDEIRQQIIKESAKTAQIKKYMDGEDSKSDRSCPVERKECDPIKEGSKDKGGPIWSCGTCGCHNAYTCLCCMACMAKFEEGKWSCGKCTVTNECSAADCGTCGWRNEIICSITLANGGERYRSINGTFCQHCNRNVCVCIVSNKYGNAESTKGDEGGGVRVADEQEGSYGKCGSSGKIAKVEDWSDKWKCGHCGMMQLYTAIACEICFYGLVDDGQWTCVRCSVINRCSNAVCNTCDFVNRRLIHRCRRCEMIDLSLDRDECDDCLSKGTESTWRCSYRKCGEINTLGDKYCSQCRIYRYHSHDRGAPVEQRCYIMSIYVWICCRCGELNSVIRSECSACKIERYDDQ